MTKEAKFTQGPWGTNGSHIYAPDGAIIAVVHNPGSKAADYPLDANRDLMAAAPDMLAALKESVKQLDAIIDDGIQTDWRAWRDDLNAAIAKASAQ